MSATTIPWVATPVRSPRARVARRGRLDAVDGLRALAALSVLCYHVCRATGATETGWLAPVLSEMKAGVIVFFVISGFLLYLPYARAIRVGATLPDWRGFAERRAVRILPAYWVALTVLTVGPLRSTIVGSSGWRYYAFAQIYDPNTTLRGLGVAWTLCVEVSFYLVLPIFAMAVARMARRWRGEPTRLQFGVVGALALACLGLRAALAGSLVAPLTPPNSTLTVATSLPGLLDWFALGLALAVMRAEWEAGEQRFRPIAALARRPGLCWAAAAAFYAIGVPLQQVDAFLAFYGLGTHVAIGISAFLLVLPAVGVVDEANGPRAARARSRPLALLRHPFMVWLGTISYGIYLWHKPVLDLVNGSVPNLHSQAFGLSTLGPFILTLAGGVSLGAASWYLVERPLHRRVSGRLNAAPGGIGLGELSVQTNLDALNSNERPAD